MKTCLFLLEENKEPTLLTEFNEPDIPLLEGNLLTIHENGIPRGEIYEVLNEIYSVHVWDKKADTIRNLFVVKSLIDKDLSLKETMLSKMGGG